MSSLNSNTFEGVQIKKKVIEKLAEETKINEFIRIYFNVTEKEIFSIYENLINMFLKVDELGKFIEDFKIYIEEEGGFLLDKMLSGHSIDDVKLNKMLFEKLNLKKDLFGDKGMFIFTRNIFQEGGIEMLFEKIKNVRTSWKEDYIEGIIGKLQNLIGDSVIKLIKNEIVGELKKQFDGVTENEIEKNYGFIIDGMLKKRIVEKNFQVIINKTKEYFKIKGIDIQLLVSGYKDYFEMVSGTDFKKTLLELKTKRKDGATNTFMKLMKNKEKLMFNESSKKPVLEELKLLIGDKESKEIVLMTEKNKNLFKQVIGTKIFYTFAVEELIGFKEDYLEIKEKKISFEEYVTKIKGKKTNFYREVNGILKGYPKHERTNKIKSLYEDVENSYESNVVFDDIFQKITKGEDIGISFFDSYFNNDVFKIISNTLLTKTQKTDEILKLYEKSLNVITTISKLYFDFNILEQKFIKKIYEEKGKFNRVGSVLEIYESNSEKIIKGDDKYKDFVEQKSISENIINIFLMQTKDLNDNLNTSKLRKKIQFIDFFYSSTSEEKTNTLFDILKICNLSKIYKNDFEDLEIYFGKSDYLDNLKRLSAFVIALGSFYRYDKYYQKSIKKGKTIYDKDFFKKIEQKKGFGKKEMNKINELQKSVKVTKSILEINKDIGGISVGLNSLIIEFIKFYLKNKEDLDFCLDFEKYINNVEEIDMIYGLYYLLNSTGTTIESYDDFILVYYGNKIFVFFSNPSFNTLNNISLLLTQKKNFQHVFIYTHVNFYLYLNGLFNRNINVKGIHQNFKNTLLLSFHDDEISDITIFGGKGGNFCYFLVRKKGKYQMLGFKRSDFVQTTFSFSVLENIIENIVYMGGSVSSEKQSDTSIRFGGINYRAGIVKDGDRVGIVMRKAQNSQSGIDLTNFMNENGLVYKNLPLPYKEESFTLYDTYDKEDVDLMLQYVMTTSGIIAISGSTGSGKSVSMRNFLNHVYKSTLKEAQWRKIATFEDPIEAENSNFMQFNFKKDELPRAVLSVKRIDLDDCLVGEIRDHKMLPGTLEGSDVISLYTTLHSPTVGSCLFLLKKWGTASNIDLVDILYAFKILMAQKLTFYLKEKYQNDDSRKHETSLGNISPIYKNSDEEKELFDKINLLTRGTIGKDINYDILKEKIANGKEKSEYLKSIIDTEVKVNYMLNKLIEKGILVHSFKENVVRRKVYYEMIDKVKIKLEFNILYSVLTGDNITGKPLQEDEIDINKLMIKILRKTREQRALEDFLRGRMSFNDLIQFGQEYFILVLRIMFIKNQVNTLEDVDRFIDDLLTNKNIN